MLVFRSISRNDREILGNHAENPGPEGRRVFPLRFFPKLVDHPPGNDAVFRANRNRAAQCKLAHDTWHGLLKRFSKENFSEVNKERRNAVCASLNPLKAAFTKL